MALFSNGRVIRAGLGRAAVWNLGNLDTHGEHRDIIGEEMDPFDCLNHNCDDLEHVELSTGSLPVSKNFFLDGKMKSHKWVHHLSFPGTMISAVGNDGSCLSLISVFLAIFTGCSALEVVRMWDVRARSLVYELGTGNNAVDSLAWDSARNCPYAARHCD